VHEVALLDLVEQLNDLLVLLPLVLLLNDQVGDVIEREEMLVHHTFSPYNPREITKKGCLLLESAVLVLKDAFEVLDL
jgi:hypothetical protein